MKNGKTIAERIRGYCDAADDERCYPTTIAGRAEGYGLNPGAEIGLLRAWADEIETEIEAARQTPKWYEEFLSLLDVALERPLNDGESIKAWLDRNYIAIPTDKDGRPWATCDECQPNDTELIGEVCGYAVNASGRVRVIVVTDNGEGDYDASELSRVVPDTQERIDEDAWKGAIDYWGCGYVNCDNCPAKVDGKKPNELYGTYNCDQAKVHDLLRRQRELDGRSAC